MVYHFLIFKIGFSGVIPALEGLEWFPFTIALVFCQGLLEKEYDRPLA